MSLVNVRIPESDAVVARSREYAEALGLEIVDDSAPAPKKAKRSRPQSPPAPPEEQAGGATADEAVGGIE